MDKLFLTPNAVYEFTYCNHENKTEKRLVQFESVAYGEFPFHTHKCWVMNAFCLDRRARRTFELGRIADDIIRVDHKLVEHAQPMGF